MLLHGWMLTPLLCYSFLSALHAASLPSVAPHQTWSSDTETQSGNRAEPSDWPRTRSFWPYWHPTGGTTETKTSSFLLLPFKLALNLWSPSPQSEAHVSEPDHFTPVSPINHSIQGSRDSNTQPAASWGKPYSSGCAGTSLRPEPAPTAAPSDARPPDGLSSRDTGLESALPESQRPAVALATESTTSNDRLPRTERVATWGSSHPRREPSTRAALLTPVVASTFPVPQRARTRPGVQPETDMGFLDGVLHKQTGMETTTKANEDVHEDEFEKHPHQRAASTASPSEGLRLVKGGYGHT
ncbi:proline-rich transmembrane protein 4 [Arapaima gigas]